MIGSLPATIGLLAITPLPHLAGLNFGKRCGEPGSCGSGDLTLHHSSMLIAGVGSSAHPKAMMIEAGRRIANRPQADLPRMIRCFGKAAVNGLHVPAQVRAVTDPAHKPAYSSSCIRVAISSSAILPNSLKAN